MGRVRPVGLSAALRAATAAFVLSAVPVAAGAADLTVVVTGLADDSGDVHIAVYDDPAGFPNPDGMRVETHVQPSGRRGVGTFMDLPPGRYAVAAYHDADGDHEFDQGLFGFPLEDYGFSMGATAFLTPPAFDAAAFDLPAGGRTVTIRVGGW